ncbi:MAG: hypothetical protein HQM08_09720 [Candidatus Riflebacteria bacterium]|nr:hypothetical protein [Candidatus Riflebacteria bacterium]
MAGKTTEKVASGSIFFGYFHDPFDSQAFCMAKRRTLAIPIQGQKLSIADAMKQKIDSEDGRKKYAKHMGTI